MCIRAAYNPFSTDLSKHVDVKYQHVVDRLSKRDVDVQYVPKDLMKASSFSEILTCVKLSQLTKLSTMQ